MSTISTKVWFPVLRFSRTGLAILALGLVVSSQVQAATITAHPKSQNVAVGLTATLSTAAYGSGTLTYQWRFQGAGLPGATTSVLSLTNMQVANAGEYCVVVTDKNGSATSSVAVLVAGMTAVWPRPMTPASIITNLPLDLTNVASLVAGGGSYALALLTDGTVKSWGNNTSPYTSTNIPDGLTNVTAIASANNHCMALRGDGTVTVWGNTNYDLTVVPAAATNIVSIAAGGDQCLALRGDGKVLNWGLNWSSRQAPSGLVPVAVVAGSSHYAALTAAGTVRAWGDKNYGQLSVPTNLNNVVALAAGANHTLALKGDGTVAAWGQNTSGQSTVPANATNVVAIMAGGASSLALRADGSVVGWGMNTYGQLNPPTGFSNIIGASLGSSFCVALRNLGEPVQVRRGVTLTNWGGLPLRLVSTVAGNPPLNYQWQRDGVDIPGETNSVLGFAALEPSQAGVYQVVVGNALGVVTGQVATLAVRPQLSIAAWGNNGDGQCNVPSGLSNLVAITSGSGRVLVLKEDGTVTGWGASGGYQSLMPASLTNAVAVSMGDLHNLALRADGTVASWGTPQTSAFTNTSSPQLSGFIRIASGSYYNLGLKTDGTVYGWADAQYAGTTPINPPSGLSGVKEIAAGYQHALALKAGGTVVTWGRNSFGQTNQPSELSNVVAIVAGDFHSLALKDDGTVCAWGDNRWGQTNVPAGLTNVVQIAASGYHSLALRADGTVAAWGDDSLGQSQVPPGLTNVAALAGGFSHSLALVADPAPCVTKPPRSQTLSPGLTATFRVTASGAAPLAYQWQFNGVDLPNATNPALVITNVQSANAGGYAVAISNQAGTVISPCANLTLGPIAAWGNNNMEQIWIPAGVTNPAAVGAGLSQTTVLQSDGTVLSWGNPWAPPPALLPPLAAVAVGNGVTLALKTDGTVTGWGNNIGKVLDVPADLTGVKAIALGESHALALRTNGQVVGWGSPSPDLGQAKVPAGLSNVVAIAAGALHSLAMRQDGTVVSWGMSSSVPAGLGNVVAIAAGNPQSLALKGDGTVVPWGTTAYGLSSPRPDLTNIVAIACGSYFDVAVRADGTVAVWGSTSGGQASIPAGLGPVVAASTFGGHIAVLTGDGRPVITVHPANRSVPAAGTVTFKLLATGNPPLRYQWQFNGTDLPGATAPALTLSNVPPTMAGGYRCVVSNELGGVTSRTAALEVTRPPLRFDGLVATSVTASGLTLRLTGLSQTGPIVLYSSTNLVDWLPVWTNAPVLGTWEYVVPLTEGENVFFRAAEAP